VQSQRAFRRSFTHTCGPALWLDWLSHLLALGITIPIHGSSHYGCSVCATSRCIGLTAVALLADVLLVLACRCSLEQPALQLQRHTAECAADHSHTTWELSAVAWLAIAFACTCTTMQIHGRSHYGCSVCAASRASVVLGAHRCGFAC